MDSRELLLLSVTDHSIALGRREHSSRDRETKNKLIARLTDAVVETLDAEPGQVRVIVNEAA